MSMPEPEIPHFAPAEPIDQPDAGPSRINEDYPDPDNHIYGDNEQNENGTSDPEKLADKPNENYISESELEDDQREAMVKRREFLKRHIEIQTKKRDELDKMHYSLVKAKKGGEQAKGQLDEVQKKLNDLEAKADKKVYLVAAPLSEGPIVVSVAGKKPDEAQIVVSDAIINLLLQRVDANPIVFHFSITNNAKHAKKPAILSLKTAVMAELRINFAPVDDTKSGVNVTVIV
ncbi:hypothetical protein SERLADRAFT_387562 [Serpula lacrymans var. lacrymans S7.9]|uniref:Uncharacterized protein n=1 Tax=Serpula lacrymans var. lacrymans (strain S7.9) TaxID=578457 RepID=F8NT29_SERL9|nr:uncharacterized protein SERLADRAFT_387562 [Serpula lacrymans var. lacrymans S7.9]EGO25502.1 hypothetical protein SERLADRAFT_387562 [Serpula lacrymans var. lacrymans S7.9]